MSRITQKGATGEIDVFSTATDSSLATLVGSTYETSDGRQFVLAQNGATALVSGHLVSAVPDTAAHIGLSVTAFTAYSASGNQPAQVTATLATTGVLPNEYAGGYLIVATGTGLGQTFKIASHPGLTAGSASVVFTLENPEGQNALALDTSSTVSLFRNPLGSANGGTASSSTVNVSTNGVVVTPTTLVSGIVGACVYPIAASTSTVATYGLLQTKGVAAMINHGGTTIGHDLGNSTQSTPVAGATETYVVANGVRIGYAYQAGVDAQASLTYLQI